LKPLPARERMLVPLNRPGAPRKLGVSVKISNATVRSLGLLLKFCFGWLGWIWSRSQERKFEAQVRSELYFLFDEYGARIIPSEQSRQATVVTIEFGVVRLRIAQHHGDCAFAVSSIFAPHDWEPFQLVVRGITRWGSSAALFTTDLPAFSQICRESVPFIQEALSESNWHSTLGKAIEAENTGISETAAGARAHGVEPIIYFSPSEKGS
jgi:hypothetical protein